MDQQINYKLKIDLDNTSSVNIAQNTFKSKSKYKKCSECNRNKRYFSETHQICCLCYEANKIIIPSGNKVIDDFIRYTITNSSIPRGKMIFVPYNKFKDVEFIAEGGFSKIYKATCVDGLTTNWNPNKHRFSRYEGTEIFALKELNNSKNISSKDLHELKIFYDISLKGGNYVNIHQGITQQNFMIITEYYELGDLTHYIAKRFFNISWEDKLKMLRDIATGIKNIHAANVIHKDYHSGNIFISSILEVITGDLGISKPLNDNEDNEIYGIIPYISPEIFQGQKYTKASDIYGFGMIMWELMTGRKPFWGQNHDAELIIKICVGLRPPIVTNAPEGYVELMQKCWHYDPNKRPTAHELERLLDMIN
ncbi:uncharacterized protein OCT59_009365 [Rhizophagus irregularis]|uniref:Cmk1p n=1 Tax=Rhizophagus irregularis (strain DAOM 197198w) TaxID=1432141 RepID=A0A015LMZ6_RHIIW|nr:Cmk1p [Rhizophagus irregularis DAOM 197198w]UZO18042.1 hypothetical protein OCT59_009365 [Rhizophagus irregularis]